MQPVAHDKAEFVGNKTSDQSRAVITAATTTTTTTGGNTHDKLLASQIKIADFVSSATSSSSSTSCNSNSNRKLPGARATVAAVAVLSCDYQHNVANNLAAPSAVYKKTRENIVPSGQLIKCVVADNKRNELTF